MGFWISNNSLCHCNRLAGLSLPPSLFLLLMVLQVSIFILRIKNVVHEFKFTCSQLVIVHAYGFFFFIPPPQFTSFEKAREIEEFFASRTKPSMARNLKQSIERVYINANWVLSVQKEGPLVDTVKGLAQRKQQETLVWPLFSRRRQADQISQLQICQNWGDNNESGNSENTSLLRIYLMELDLSNYGLLPLFFLLLFVLHG